jgi:ubiquinone/menaquinone biosynthesis C-methylase UbiE
MNPLKTANGALASYTPNQKYYDTAGVVQFHKEDLQLWPVEAAVLSSLANEIRDQPILDIGIGAGRTTPYLQNISADYTGIDYSEKMIEAAKEKYGGANLLVCDARRMSAFHDGQFKAAFFFGGGICDMSGADRMLTLREVHRVLQGDGIFVLAAHNLDVRIAQPCPFPDWDWLGRPMATVKDNLRRMRAYISFWANRASRKIHDKGYAVLMDYEDCYDEWTKTPGMLLRTYYITRKLQVRQMLDTGFSSAHIVDKAGRIMDEQEEVKQGFLMCIARKG